MGDRFLMEEHRLWRHNLSLLAEGSLLRGVYRMQTFHGMSCASREDDSSLKEVDKM